MKQNHLNEFNDIFNSLEPFIKDDLENIDSRLRRVWSEARTCGVPKQVIEKEIKKRFVKLFLEVAKGESA